MKILILFIALLSFQCSFAQSYEQLMDLASAQIKSQKYRDALSTLKKAFHQQGDRGKYDYANALVVALQCGKNDLAIAWLEEGVKLGLGDNEQELSYFKNDSIFKPILANSSYKRILKHMEFQIQERYKRDRIWQNEVAANAISEKQAFYQHAQAGFALYHVDQEGLEIPYLVFVPRGYHCNAPTRALFFFHGGVVSDTAAFTIDPQTRFEPIFTIGDSTNSIVIYPFQKGNPGWKNYKYMSAVISTILADVKLRYFIDTDRIYLGGLSMGGNVSYQFAQEQQTDFRAFYAISAKPKIAEVSHPIYSLHAKDDSLYRYDDLLKVRRKVKKQQKKWMLKSVAKGGHGFMYLPMGEKSTLDFFRMMFNKEEE
ncbi:dienelactone hydrolase family protein [Sphingobacterium sp. HMA12]|uniref:dienelactone hydrolase family protein n=1 Tax=Sphingobacterium sp. HMA12 TaxID=2050894 RepID=UPI000CEA4B28|nr:dienelactone hydrolase family protein [Sphingobacterium sp. HMA12]